MSENPEDINKVFSELASSATMSALDAQSNEMHEVFLSLLRAGFNQRQSLYIVSMAIVTPDYSDDDDDDDDSHEMGVTLTLDQPQDGAEDLQASTEEESFSNWGIEDEEEEESSS